MINLISKLFFTETSYIYLFETENKYYGLCGCTISLIKLNPLNNRYYFLDDFFKGKTQVTESVFNKLKAQPNSKVTELL